MAGRPRRACPCELPSAAACMQVMTQWTVDEGGNDKVGPQLE